MTSWRSFLLPDVLLMEEWGKGATAAGSGRRSLCPRRSSAVSEAPREELLNSSDSSPVLNYSRKHSRAERDQQ